MATTFKFMNREIRKVSKDWNHPILPDGNYKPLYDNYKERSEDFLRIANEKGLQEALDYYGQCPDKDDHMPDWEESEKTHYMLYETISGGTPVSGKFESIEEFTKWVIDNLDSPMNLRRFTSMIIVV